MGSELTAVGAGETAAVASGVTEALLSVASFTSGATAVGLSTPPDKALESGVDASGAAG